MTFSGGETGGQRTNENMVARSLFSSPHLRFIDRDGTFCHSRGFISTFPSGKGRRGETLKVTGGESAGCERVKEGALLWSGRTI